MKNNRDKKEDTMKKFLIVFFALALVLGAAAQAQAGNTGNITVKVTIQKISVALTGAAAWNIGVIAAGSTQSTAQDFFKAKNDGNVPEKLTLTVTAPAGWTHGTANGENTFAMQYQTVGSPQWNDINPATGGKLSDTTAVDYAQPFGLQFIAPSSTNVAAEQVITVTVTAEAAL
jgi:hypothetical protein